MAGLIRSSVNWLKTSSDFTHHSIVLGLSLSSVPVVNSLSPSVATSLCLGSVGVQLGKQMWVANVAGNFCTHLLWGLNFKFWTPMFGILIHAMLTYS